MKKIIFILIVILSACNSSLKKESKSTDAVLIDTIKIKMANDKFKKEMKKMNFLFENDSITITIEVDSIILKKEIPDKINYKLTLIDKISNKDNKINIEGNAVMTSQNESFFDDSDIDNGEYFAADYFQDFTNYTIKIRMDIENYQACAIYFNLSQSPGNLKDFSFLLKRFPQYYVLKIKT